MSSVLFGVVTQHQGDVVGVSEKEGNFIGTKEALVNLVAHLPNAEDTFTGRLNIETIIDPIALYTEI